MRKVVVVGGGTAGWLTALSVARRLAPTAEVVLIESPGIGAVGVGEATVPTMPATLGRLGIGEDEFLHHCDATFKLGIRFVGWRHGSLDGDPDVYWHPFGVLPALDGTPDGLIGRWLAAGRRGFARECFETPRLCEAGRAPKRDWQPDFRGLVPYAYHMDAGRFAALLESHARAAGVRHVEDRIVRVARDERGWIDAVFTESGGSLTADLFFDCSGFRSLLVGEALEEPFHSLADRLVCDRAVAIWVDGEEAVPPFTTATALRHGWVWQIPLNGRVGTGYVYSSQFLDAGGAEGELRDFLGTVSSGCDARHLALRVGHLRRCWVKNCVAIGLAGGFIEPLESTGIFLIEAALHQLEEIGVDPGRRGELNRGMAALYRELADFIVLHYCLTERDDTEFWRLQRSALETSTSLAEQVERWQRGLAPRIGDQPYRIFGEGSYACILDGLRPASGARDGADPQLDAVLEAVAARAERMVAELPDHGDYVRMAGVRRVVRSAVS